MFLDLLDFENARLNRNLSRLNNFPKPRFEESESGAQVYLDVPGFKRDEIEVECSGQSVFVKGEISRYGKSNKIDATYALSKRLDPKSCEASLEDGVLVLSFKSKSDLVSKIPIK